MEEKKGRKGETNKPMTGKWRFLSFDFGWARLFSRVPKRGKVKKYTPKFRTNFSWIQWGLPPLIPLNYKLNTLS